MGMRRSRWSRSCRILIFLVAQSLSRVAAQENWTQVVPLEAYQPDYFMVGQPDTKIQFSLKVRIIQDQNLYFGYSQLMMWQLFRPSPYLSDVNYEPEFFYRFHLCDSKTRWLDFGPFEHQSNGQGGANERSWDRTYIRYHDEWTLPSRAKIRGEVKAWVPYALNPSNRNLPNYRGIWEGSVILSNFLGASELADDLIFRFYAGGPSNVDPTRGGQELIFRVKSAKRKILPVLMFELFHGYGESLIVYQHSYWAYRMGIGF